MQGLQRRLRSRCRCLRRVAAKKTEEEDVEGGELLPDSLVEGGTADVSLLRATLDLTQVFYEKGSRGKAICLSLTVTVLLLIEIGAFVWYSDIQKSYMTALQTKNVQGFYAGLWRTAELIVFISPFIALHEYTAGILRLSWRSALVHRLGRSYLAGTHSGQNAFYRLTVTGEIDNPDQRICQDVSDFVEVTFSLVQDGVRTMMTLIGFTGMLYSISPRVCTSVIAYALMGTLVTALGFGPWISYFTQLRLKQEAGMRYNLIRVRENAESVAFFRGGPAEWDHFVELFNGLIATVYRAIIVHTGFHVFNRSFHWATFAVAPLMVGPAYLRGEVEFGVISQAGMAFGTILGSLTMVMNRLDSLTDCSVRVRRLHALDRVLQREAALAARMQKPNDAGTTYIESLPLEANSTALLRVTGVTLVTPWRPGVTPHVLAEDVSFQLAHGQSLLIVGESGIGKSSLLRVIAGLWSEGRGRVELCSGDRSIFFLPQRPYMFLGSLREQLLYPRVHGNNLSDAELEEALQQVNLGYLLNHHSLQDTKEWASLLSLGEQQRINFARVLLQKGLRMALVDEGTSACDPANEARLYEILRSRLQCYVSIGHRPALQKYHTHALWLQRQPAAVSDGRDMPAAAAFLPMAEFQRCSGLTATAAH